MCKVFQTLRDLKKSFEVDKTIIGTACKLIAQTVMVSNESHLRIRGTGSDATDPGEYDFIVFEREMAKVCARYFGLKERAHVAWNQTSSYNDGHSKSSWSWGVSPPLAGNARRHAPAVAHVIHAVVQTHHLNCDCYKKPLYRKAALLPND